MNTHIPEYQVLALSGSLRAHSYNTALLRAARRLSPRSISIRLHLGLDDMPLYNEDLEQGPLPTTVHELYERVREADGLLIATPEHNSAIPAALKNAIDWMSRMPDGAGMSGKPVAIAGASPGALGTVRAQLGLRQILGSVGAEVLTKPEVMVFRAHERFDADGTLTDPFTESLLTDLLSTLATRIKRGKPTIEQLPAAR